MITAKGLELRLREMGVWTKFQKNQKPKWMCFLHEKYEDEILGAFRWDKTKEGFDFWNDISNKIDEVKL